MVLVVDVGETEKLKMEVWGEFFQTIMLFLYVGIHFFVDTAKTSSALSRLSPYRIF